MGRIGLLVLTGYAMAAAACGAGKGSYVPENESILATLPEIPGVQRLGVVSDPYYEDSGAPIGWTTLVTYKPPEEISDHDVLQFYLDTMPDEWQPRVEGVPIVDVETGEREGVVLTVTFERGTALVWVNTDNMNAGGPHTFDVGVDHNAVRE